MAISKGRALLLKVGSGAGAVTVAAMRSTRFQINGETVDATSKDDNGMQRLLSEGGTARVSVSASGVLSGSAQAAEFVNRTLNRTLHPYRLEFDDGDVLEGSFQMTSFEALGDYNGEQTYSLKLESSGAVTVTAVGG